MNNWADPVAMATTRWGKAQQRHQSSDNGLPLQRKRRKCSALSNEILQLKSPGVFLEKKPRLFHVASGETELQLRTSGQHPTDAPLLTTSDRVPPKEHTKEVKYSKRARQAVEMPLVFVSFRPPIFGQAVD